jgi:hypothetical protein
MALLIRSRVVGEVMVGEVSGRTTLPDAEGTFSQALRECVEQGLARLLLDCRRVIASPTTLERYGFGRFVAREMEQASAIAGPIRVAIVARLPLVEAARLGETVARNRGALVRITTEWEPARQWVGLDPSAQPLAEDGGPAAADESAHAADPRSAPTRSIGSLRPPGA